MKLRTIIALLLSSVIVACGSDSDNPPAPSGVSRTVLVYMASSNSLGDGTSGARYDLLDIAEMEQAVATGVLNGGRLLVFHAGSGMTPALKEVTPRGTVTLRTYEGMGSSLSVSTMGDILDDAFHIAPADDYGLVLWSHASGWLDNGKPAARSWGIDDSNGSANRVEMSIPDLASALSGHYFSFIYFDCCFMGNIESLYEIKSSARYVVASPTETPLDGMPYEMNVPCFFKEQPALTEAATNTFNYYDKQSGASRSCTMAVYDMRKIDAVASAFRDVVMTNTQPAEGWQQQQYGYGRNFGNRFYDFAHYVHSLTDSQQLTSRFDRAMSEFVLYSDHTDSMWGGAINLIHCNGVSSYIITDADDAVASRYNYFGLKWWKEVTSPAFGD